MLHSHTYLVAAIMENKYLKHLWHRSAILNCTEPSLCWTALFQMSRFFVRSLKVSCSLRFISPALKSLFSVRGIPAVSQRTLLYWEAAAVTVQFLAWATTWMFSGGGAQWHTLKCALHSSAAYNWPGSSCQGGAGRDIPESHAEKGKH